MEGKRKRRKKESAAATMIRDVAAERLFWQLNSHAAMDLMEAGVEPPPTDKELANRVAAIESLPRESGSKESQAIALLLDHPDWEISQFADALGVNRTSPYRWTRFMAAREHAVGAIRGSVRRGSKHDGIVEAVE